MTNDTTAIIPVRVTRDINVDQLESLCLSGRNANTIRAYRTSLEDFARFLQAPTMIDGLRELLTSGQGPANALVAAYRNHLVDSGKSPGTTNARICAIRSVVKDARRFGLVPWTLEVKNVEHQAYIDTAGPGAEAFGLMAAQVETVGNDAKRCRDRAILRMLRDLGLRRKELVGIDMADLDPVGKSVRILGKGRTQKQSVTVPDPTFQAINDWIDRRGSHDGPLFVNLDRACQNAGAQRRLTGEGVRRLVAKYGKVTGRTVRPHGLRHLAITTALDKTNGNLRAVRQFSRHRSLETISHYDDNRRDLGGDIAKMIAED